MHLVLSCQSEAHVLEQFVFYFDVKEKKKIFFVVAVNSPVDCSLHFMNIHVVSISVFMSL